MPKKRIGFQFELPKYTPIKREWRREIRDQAHEAANKRGVDVPLDPKLEIELTVLLPDLPIHDVDNRLKDVMDALQGRLSGTGKKRKPENPIIPNDNMVRRVIIEKALGPREWDSSKWANTLR